MCLYSSEISVQKVLVKGSELPRSNHDIKNEKRVMLRQGMLCWGSFVYQS